jgi:hypothetical protein
MNLMFSLECQSLCHQRKSEKLAEGIGNIGYSKEKITARITTAKLSVHIPAKSSMLTLA